MNTSSTDRIEKQITIKAPRSRVWDALADAEKFGSWFGVDFTGVKFTAGKQAIGKMTYPGFEGHKFEIEIDRVEPESLFSYRWHPYAIDPNYDYSAEPMTLCSFELEDVPDGTKLTVIESGFDQVPLTRRAEAFRMDSGGWEMQIERIAAYVIAHS
jgi:uncharacterized protein YndB with AHSA1/START domain